MVSYQAFITILYIFCVSKQNSELKKLKIKQTQFRGKLIRYHGGKNNEQEVLMRKLPTIQFRELHS